MQITQKDLQRINTFSISYNIKDGVIYISHDLLKIWITKCPFYFDRGRYELNIDNIRSVIPIVDAADLFPRYFFKLSNLFDELNEWLVFNEKELQKVRRKNAI